MGGHTKSSKNKSMVQTDSDGAKRLKGSSFFVVPEERIIEALYANGGLINPTALALGINSSNLWTRIRRRTNLNDAMWDARKQIADLAVSKLKIAVENGEAWAIKTVLTNSTFGKELGYFGSTTQNINIIQNNEEARNLENLSMEDLEKLYELTKKTNPTIIDGEFAESE